MISNVKAVLCFPFGNVYNNLNMFYGNWLLEKCLSIEVYSRKDEK